MTVKPEQLQKTLKKNKVNEKVLFIKLLTTVNTVIIFLNLMAFVYAFSGLFFGQMLMQVYLDYLSLS